MSKKNPRSYSLVVNIKVLIFAASLIICVNIVISAISIANIKRQNFEVIQNSIEIFQQNTSTDLNAIQHFIQWIVLKELLIQSIEQTENDYEQSLAMDALRTRVANYQYATGNSYHYFIYLTKQDLFFNASEMTLPYSDYLEIEDFIIHNATADKKQSFSWQFGEFNGSTYMYYILLYNNRTFAAFINVEDLFMPLSNMDFGKKGIYTISDADGTTILSYPDSDTYISSPFYSMYTFSGTEYKLPYDIQLYSDNYHNYGQLFFLQLFVIITSSAVCLILAAIVINMYRRVIKPIEQFSEQLSNLNAENDLLDFQSTRVRELEQANLQFKNLIREIKKLKINVYENELEKKHFQITFLQHQIKPHFYLNCLTTISSMAQLKDYKNIESMVLFTSRYLRYLFQTDKDFLPVEYELAHIQAYLDIQQLRLGPVFTYTCSITESDKQALIPPLLLITFIENTLKHNTSSAEKLKIQLSIQAERKADIPFLKIDIVDSGQGFPPETLENLAHQRSPRSEQGTHIGITNSMQRLLLLYGNSYEIAFFNEETGGAHIRLSIPYQTQEGTK